MKDILISGFWVYITCWIFNVSDKWEMFSLLLWHIDHCRLFKAKTCLCIYILNIYIICKHIFWHTLKWFRVLLYKSQILTCPLFVHIVCSIWPIDKTFYQVLLLQAEWSRSSGNEGVLRFHQGWGLAIRCFNGITGYSLAAGGLTLFRDAVGVFYSHAVDWASVWYRQPIILVLL